MARTLHKLKDALVKSEKLKAGRHSDGGGLYLNVAPRGSKSWIFMWTRRGKRHEMGLGGYPATTLAVARKKAQSCREAVAEGRNPISERAKADEPTFGKCADDFIAAMETSWRNEKHRAQWRMTLDEYCRHIRFKRVSEITTDDVLSVLNPIWQEKPETASRLRGRIERVLDYAKAKGWREGENPALWRGHLRNVLPARKKLTRGHHAAMPYRDVPSFMQVLEESNGIAALALRFLILTAARSGEVIQAKWCEFNLQQKVWTVPAHRMKGAREHRVPLTDEALRILGTLKETAPSEFVFPGQKKDSPLSVTSMQKVLRVTGQPYTVHGFRSSFRDWAGDETSFPREVTEAALAHRTGDETELAYRRSDALEKRRKLMTSWASFCGKSKGNVVRLNHMEAG